MSISIACQHTHHDISFEDFVKVEIAEMVAAILRDNGFSYRRRLKGVKMANQITRTFVTAIAYAWVVTGKDETGKPTMERVGDIEFVATKPTQNDAYRALKNAGIKCTMEFCAFDIVKETVYAMDIHTFVAHAVEVTRLPNGRVLLVDMDEGDE